MAVQYETVTPGFDYEMVPVTETTVVTTSVYYSYPTLAEYGEADTPLISHDSSAEAHTTEGNELVQFPTPPPEFFSPAATRWVVSRSLSPWSTPTIRDELGHVQYEAKISGFIHPECRLINTTTGLIPYMSAPTGFLEWRNPYNIFIGSPSEFTQPYASLIRVLTFPGLKFNITFANGEPTLELAGNWCNRTFTISRGTIAVAQIRRRRMLTFEYTIAAGENIPFLHLVIEMLAIICVRNRR